MTLSVAQQSIIQAPHRFKVVIAGRRFGKTHLAIRQLAYHAREPFKTVWAVYPSYRQAKMVAWKKLKQRLLDLRWVGKVNETELTLDLKNGSTISLKGADNHDSLRGVGLDYLVIDEFADIDPDAWYETLRPTLSDRQGHALFIGTPKGLNWAHDLYSNAVEFPLEWCSFQYTTIDGGRVPEQEIEQARRELDERTFRQEYLASFETFSGRIFYAFDRVKHVKPYRGELPREIYIGMDFNVDPMSAVVIVKLPEGNLHIIDELRIFGSNTDEMVAEIRARYPNNSIVCLPDPAGAQRKTSAGGRTDHTILRQANFRVIAPHSHNSIRDGINAVNSKLCSSIGIVGLYVDAGCKYAIETFEKYTYKEGTSQPDKQSGFDHLADAIRYAIDYLAPIRLPMKAPEIRSWGHKLAVPRGQALRNSAYG
jgi:hypothetical protein